MYGLINQALKDMVCARAGQSVWSEVCSAVGISDDDFDELHPYPDKVTYSLVHETSKKLSVAVETMLRDFGHYWISFTAHHGYGDIMSLFGSDLRTCLKNLNRMHGHMGALMPQLKAPRFVVIENSDAQITVQYFSDRSGLAPFVVGLLTGLADKFEEAVVVRHLPKSAPNPFEEFEITFSGLVASNEN